MKRFLLACLAALLLLLSLCACAQEAPAKDTGPSTSTPAPEVPAERDPLLGSFSDGVYRNDFLGICCAVDESWSVYSDAQLAQLNGLVLDTMTDAQLAEQLKKTNVALFYATAGGGHQSVNVTLENIGKLNGVLLDEKTYAQLNAEQLPAALESMGLVDVSAHTASVHFAGQEHTMVRVHGVRSGVDFYEKIVCIKMESYFGIVTVASYHENVTRDLLDMFTAVS